MSELAQGSISFLAVVLTACSAWLWMLGGRPGGRIYGRLIAPLFFSSSILIISWISGAFHTIYFLFVPLYILISHSGHHSFVRRLIECWCYALPGVLIIYIYPELWRFWTIQMLIFSPTATVIGHFLNQKTAPRIEFLVNFLRIALIGFTVS